MPFQIVRNDITKVKADAVVNTANPRVLVGPGVDAAIYNAAGRDWLLEKRAEIGEIEVGDVAVTPAGNLDAKYIFHESGPVWIDGEHRESDLLRQCYDKCLNLAVEYRCESIAFPLLASGAYGFPKDISLRIAIDAFGAFLFRNEMDIYLVVYDDETKKLSDEMFNDVRGFVDRRYYAGNSDRAFSNDIKGGSLDAYIDSFEQQEIQTFGEYLQALIVSKGMTNKEVYYKSNLTKQYFSKLINNKVAQPAREKLLCVAVALNLDIDETVDFLLHAGYAISPYSKIDLVFEYYIRKRKYDVYEISFVLEDLGIKGGLWPELQ